MQHARVFTLLACLFAATLTPGTVAAGDSTGPLAWESGAIQPRRQVPDDPLAGLPTEDTERPARGKSDKDAALCKLDANPASARDIGDLRATLAFVQRGPRAWPCPARAASRTAGLRITVDGDGKITTVEAATGDAATANRMAKRLTGKAIAPRAQGDTTGTVVLTFLPGNGR